MKRQFREWHRVRANIINEVNPLSAAAQGAMNWAKRPFQQWANDPHSALNRPSSYQDAITKSKPAAQQLAQRLGLDRMMGKDPHLADSLARIAAARIYGPRDDNDENPIGGAVQEPDLAYVWKYLQRANKAGKTLAQIKGINRPRLIITSVPVTNPNAAWNWTRDTAEFETRAAREVMAQQQQQQQQPDPADPAATGGSSGPVPAVPSTNPGAVPSPGKKPGGDVAAELKKNYDDLNNQLATTKGKGPRSYIKQKMRVYDYLYYTYTGTKLTPPGPGPGTPPPGTPPPGPSPKTPPTP
jgi:hypothetical protein